MLNSFQAGSEILAHSKVIYLWHVCYDHSTQSQSECVVMREHCLWSVYVIIWVPKDLGSSAPQDLPPATHVASLGLVPLHAHSSSWEKSHSPGFSNILGSPLQIRLHLHTVMQSPLRASLRGLQAQIDCLVLAFLHNSLNPESLTPSIPARWMKLPSSSVILGWSLALLDHSYISFCALALHILTFPQAADFEEQGTLAAYAFFL